MAQRKKQKKKQQQKQDAQTKQKRLRYLCFVCVCGRTQMFSTEELSKMYTRPSCPLCLKAMVERTATVKSSKEGGHQPASTKPFVCDDCGMRFRSAAGLHLHWQERHAMTRKVTTGMAVQKGSDDD